MAQGIKWSIHRHLRVTADVAWLCIAKGLTCAQSGLLQTLTSSASVKYASSITKCFWKKKKEKKKKKKERKKEEKKRKAHS